MSDEKKKKMLKRVSKEERKNLCVRFTHSERVEAQKKADEYCDGKLSEWVRAAALSWTPSKEELE